MLTANGEVFDRNAISAASPTLPMPVNVRVTNLENGRSIVVRVNDRGPFVNGRLIDLSEHAADLLGYRINGTARVRVTYLGRADLYGPGLAPASQETPPEIAMAVPAAPVQMVEMATLPPVSGAKVAPPACRGEPAQAGRSMSKSPSRTRLPTAMSPRCRCPRPQRSTCRLERLPRRPMRGRLRLSFKARGHEFILAARTDGRSIGSASDHFRLWGMPTPRSLRCKRSAIVTPRSWSILSRVERIS